MSVDELKRSEEIDKLLGENSPYKTPFAEVETPYQQLQFYRRHFNLIVSDFYCLIA